MSSCPPHPPYASPLPLPGRASSPSGSYSRSRTSGSVRVGTEGRRNSARGLGGLHVRFAELTLVFPEWFLLLVPLPSPLPCCDSRLCCLAVTILGVVLALALFCAEGREYMGMRRRHDMSVHMARNEVLPLDLRLSFSRMPCSLINIDVVDEGEVYEHGELWSELHKVPLDSSGAPIPEGRERVDLKRDREFRKGLADESSQHDRTLQGAGEESLTGDEASGGGGAGAGTVSEQGGLEKPVKPVKNAKSMREEIMKDMEEAIDSFAKTHGTPTFGDRKASLERGEGCLVYGQAHLKRMAGVIQFHMAAMQWYYMEELMYSGGTERVLNMSHHIERLSFGEPVPGAVNPLDGHGKVTSAKEGTYQYYLKTVPTEYVWRSGKKMFTHQYSVNELALPLSNHVMPQVVFKYDVSPIQVTITEQSLGFVHFLVRVCAVIGGVFAVTGMIDKWVFRLINSVTISGQHQSAGEAARRIL